MKCSEQKEKVRKLVSFCLNVINTEKIFRVIERKVKSAAAIHSNADRS